MLDIEKEVAGLQELITAKKANADSIFTAVVQIFGHMYQYVKNLQPENKKSATETMMQISQKLQESLQGYFQQANMSEELILKKASSPEGFDAEYWHAYQEASAQIREYVKKIAAELMMPGATSAQEKLFQQTPQDLNAQGKKNLKVKRSDWMKS